MPEGTPNLTAVKFKSVAVDGEAYRFSKRDATTRGSEVFREPYQPELIGQYNESHGFLAFVAANGRTQVAPSTPENIKMLEQAGYTKGSFPVFGAGGEELCDAKRWSELAAIMG